MGLLDNIRNFSPFNNGSNPVSPQVAEKAATPVESSPIQSSGNLISNGIDRCVSFLGSGYNLMPEKVKLVGKIYLGSIAVSKTIGIGNFTKGCFHGSVYALGALKDWVVLPLVGSALEGGSEVVIALLDNVPELIPTAVNLYLLYKIYKVGREALANDPGFPSLFSEIFNSRTVQNTFNIGFSATAFFVSLYNGNNIIIPSIALLASIMSSDKVKVKPEKYLTQRERLRLETLKALGEESERRRLESRAERILHNQPYIYSLRSRQSDLRDQATRLPDGDAYRQDLLNEANGIDNLILRLNNPPAEAPRAATRAAPRARRGVRRAATA